VRGFVIAFGILIPYLDSTFFVMRLLTLFFLLICINSFSQSSKRYRGGPSFGIGVQAFEPTGFNLQYFRGFFNENNSSLATYGVWELGIGKENMLELANDKVYAGGKWVKGGLRFDLNYLHPVFTVYKPFVFQTYVGGGLQTGTRLYTNSEGEQSNVATGVNLLVRVEYVTHGIDLGRDVWFFSVYGDIKFHSDFSESFDYVSPVVGIRVRRGR